MESTPSTAKIVLFLSDFIWGFLQTRPLPVKKATSQNKQSGLFVLRHFLLPNKRGLLLRCCVYITEIQSKEVTHLSLHGWCDVGERSFYTEKMEGPDSARGEGKKPKNMDVLNLRRNSRLRSSHFDKEKISTDGYMRSDRVYFAWNNWGKPLAWGKDWKDTGQ